MAWRSSSFDRKSFQDTIPLSTDPVEVLARLRGTTLNFDINRILSRSKPPDQLKHPSHQTRDPNSDASLRGAESGERDAGVEVRHMSRVSPSSKSAVRNDPFASEDDS